MKKSLTLSVLALFSICAFAQEKSGVISLPQLKITMSSLNEAGYQNNQPIIMNFLPGSQQFSPNINLVIQEYGDGLDSYKKLTDDQLASIGIAAIQSKVEKGTYTLEYESDNNGVMLHMLTIVKARANKVYLVTATATVEQWNSNKAELTRVANSLEFTK